MTLLEVNEGQRKAALEELRQIRKIAAKITALVEGLVEKLGAMYQVGDQISIDGKWVTARRDFRGGQGQSEDLQRSTSGPLD